MATKKITTIDHITRLKVQGFRSLKNIDVKLGPLNVIIGKNACGKSNFLDVFAFLAEASNGKIKEAIFDRGSIHWMLTADEKCKELVIKLDTKVNKTDPMKYEIKLIPYEGLMYAVKNEKLVSQKKGMKVRTIIDASLWSFSSDFKGIQAYIDEYPAGTEKIVLPKLREDISSSAWELVKLLALSTVYTGIDISNLKDKAQAQASNEYRLKPDGENLISVLHLLMSKKSIREKIFEIIELAYPEVKDLSFPPGGGKGNLSLSWSEAPYQDNPFSINYLSDGILRFLCLVAVLESPYPPSIILLDEPELGLHPSLLGIVAGMMRHASANAQVIAVTHSPQLLDHFEADEILIMDKVDGATTIERLGDRPNIDKWLEDYSAGELWLQGEIGGRP